MVRPGPPIDTDYTILLVNSHHEGGLQRIRINAPLRCPFVFAVLGCPEIFGFHRGKVVIFDDELRSRERLWIGLQFLELIYADSWVFDKQTNLRDANAIFAEERMTQVSTISCSILHISRVPKGGWMREVLEDTSRLPNIE